jgi:hypothetical protein
MNMQVSILEKRENIDVKMSLLLHFELEWKEHIYNIII